jgi:hypothetical protein
VIFRYPQGLADLRDTEPFVGLLQRQEHQGAQRVVCIFGYVHRDLF